MRNFLAGFLSCVALIIAIGALARSLAGETWFVSTVASYHYNTDKKYEQQNWGFGIEQKLADNFAVIAGGYRNSNRRDSMYFGAAWAPVQIYGPLRLGVAAMMVGGYETPKNTEVLKAAFPFLTAEYKGFGFNIPIIPPVSGTTPGVIGLQFKVRW